MPKHCSVVTREKVLVAEQTQETKAMVQKRHRLAGLIQGHMYGEGEVDLAPSGRRGG